MSENNSRATTDVRMSSHVASPPPAGPDARTAWAGKRTVGRGLRLARRTENDGSNISGAIGVNMRVAAGRTVFAEDDDAEYFFEVLSGTVSASRSVADGRRQILDFLSPGDLFGLSSNDRYPYSADAVTEAIVVRYRRRDLEARIGNNPASARHLLAAVIDELRVAQDRLLLLGRKSATERVASFLLMMADRPTRRGGIDNHVDLPMGRADIADYLGLTVETVSRTFTRLGRDGIIAACKPSRIDILSAEMLYGLAEGNLDVRPSRRIDRGKSRCTRTT